jgi:N6-adenosine-specific RNA methylase IME4
MEITSQLEQGSGSESDAATLFSALRGQRFGCILADPPWSYEATNPTCSWRPYLERGEAPQNVNHYYETMPLDQILAMPINEIAEKDSVLFLWATVPLLPEAIRVMEAWGYKYKTTLTWEKENGTGMGYWFRGVTEHVLFGVRGNVKAFRSPVKNLLRSKRGRHSAKPQQFHDIIESVTPGMQRVELFGRYARANWTTWGNQVERDLLSPENAEVTRGEVEARSQQGG